MADDQGKVKLLELSRSQLTQWLDTLAEPKFRAGQLWQWVWQKLAKDFDVMTNVSRSLREKLSRLAVISWPEVVTTQNAVDGTIKLLLRLTDGATIETVLIPAENRVGEIRWSQCVSTQVGCAMGCSFCATGQMGLTRNLTTGEILGQILVGRYLLNDTRPDRPVLRNLVFMGMGEPLLNLNNLMPALEVLHDEHGLNFSPRRITVSTCGIRKGLKTLGDSGLAYLAISLHAPNQQLRQQIMPKAAQWPLEEMLASLQGYPLKNRERITFEYLLLGSVNDSPEHARQLVKILSPLKAKLNLIVYNPVPGSPYQAPTPESVAEFQKILCDKHITAILRKSRGAEIAAACGQLKAVEGV